MITTKIRSLFQFIEYLHSNIENFNRFNYLIDELDVLYEKRNKLNPDKNFFDKKEVEKLQSIIDEKNTLLLTNTANKTIQKAISLNIYNTKNYASIYNLNKDEAYNIINVVDETEIPEILDKKSKYIEFRTKTRFAVLEQKDLYDKLDLILKVIFNFFDKNVEEEFNELPRYEQIVISNLTKHKRQMNNNVISKALADFFFFQIEVIADLKFEGETYKDKKQKNNDSILTPENWEQHEETFFAQRMATYKESYTLEEKVKLELSALETLPINKTDYQILKDRYRNYLKALPPQQIKSKSNIPAKYYALYHWILIEMGIENDFERNYNDLYVKSKIEAFAKEKYKGISAQGFYRAFIDIDITNKLVISNSFGNGYKEKIYDISNNNTKVIVHLKSFPN